MNIFMYSALFVIIYIISLYIIGLYKKDSSIIDIGWGGGFIGIAGISLWYTGLYLPRHLLVTLLTCIWGMRITAHIGLRHHKEDPRYTSLRTQWGNLFAMRSFVQLYIPQAVALFIIALPIICVNSSNAAGVGVLDIIGLGIWAVGMLFETVGDYQLAVFLHDEHNRGRVMNKGLWRYTRHPNYFGEALIWWGIFCIALSVPYGFLTIISPITITFLLRYVSGVPLIEQMFANNREYELYKESTSAFFPWFPFTDEDIA